jgi:hypothetical protein
LKVDVYFSLLARSCAIASLEVDILKRSCLSYGEVSRTMWKFERACV